MIMDDFKEFWYCLELKNSNKTADNLRKNVK